MVVNVKKSKKGLIEILNEYNISKRDVVIYSVSLGIIAISLSVFILFSGNLSSQSEKLKLVNKKMNYAVTLINKKEQIKTEFSQLNNNAVVLLNKFLGTREINDFQDYVNKMADQYKATGVSFTPITITSGEHKIIIMPKWMSDFFISKDVFKKDEFVSLSKKARKMKLAFSKQPISLNMEITLGNLLAFLYCMENSSKYISISNINISNTGENVEKIRVNMIVSAFTTKTLKSQIGSILSKENLLKVEQSASNSKLTLLVQHPEVNKVRKGVEITGELIKYVDGTTMEVRPIFRSPGPSPIIKVCPDDTVVRAVVGDVVAFEIEGRKYFGFEGDYIRTRGKSGDIVPKFPKLKVKKIKEKTVVLVNEDLPLDLPSNEREKEIPIKEKEKNQ